MIRHYAPINRLLATQTLQQIRYYLPHGGEVELEVVGGGVFREALLEDVSQVVRDRH